MSIYIYIHMYKLNHQQINIKILQQQQIEQNIEREKWNKNKKQTKACPTTSPQKIATKAKKNREKSKEQKAHS